MRLLSRALLALALLLALAVAALYLAVRGSLPPLDGERAAAGLAADAVIERDAFGAVTITGQSRDDVAFATGFAHAQDRYFQMDLARRMSVGAARRGVRRRRARHRRAASRAPLHEHRGTRCSRQLPPEQGRCSPPTRAGVNAGLASLRVRPFEYLLLRQRPEPWRARGQPAGRVLRCTCS